MDAFLSFRENDVLMLSEIERWCRLGLDDECDGIRQCTFFITSESKDSAIFPEVQSTDVETLLADVPNARVVNSRLDFDIISENARQMTRPCRLLVSGPEGFNKAARAMLDDIFHEDEIVVLAS